jgi:hypothetical protein
MDPLPIPDTEPTVLSIPEGSAEKNMLTSAPEIGLFNDRKLCAELLVHPTGGQEVPARIAEELTRVLLNMSEALRG